MAKRVTEVVCPRSEKKWPHCLRERLVLPAYDVAHVCVSERKRGERKGKKMINMKFLFSSVRKQSIISAWILNCVS